MTCHDMEGLHITTISEIGYGLDFAHLRERGSLADICVCGSRGCRQMKGRMAESAHIIDIDDF